MDYRQFRWVLLGVKKKHHETLRARISNEVLMWGQSGLYGILSLGSFICASYFFIEGDQFLSTLWMVSGSVTGLLSITFLSANDNT